MRRLKVVRKEAERGAAGVTVALLMLVLIGAGALAVDVGQIYGERAQLQNGADAAALAVARACFDDPCTQAEADAVAIELANQNALDGGSAVFTPVDLSVAKQVTVQTSTRQGAAGPGFLSKMFASALNAPPVTVGAHATAGLFTPGGGGAFPLAFSNKCWDLSGAVDTGTLQKISWKPGTTCTGPSGTTVPGGWGWLADPDADCYAVTSVGNTAGSDPGNDKPTACEEVLQGWLDVLAAGGEVNVTFPVFDTSTGTGNTAVFHIIGYATFKIIGWKFGNNGVYEYHNTTAALGNSNLACAGGNDRCLIGQFVKYISDGSGGGGTGGVDLGTVEIRLSN